MGEVAGELGDLSLSAAIGPAPAGQPVAAAMFTVGTTGEKGLGSCG